MSLKALVEVMIHVDTFRNIDLFYQGLYYMRFRLYYKRDYESLSKQEGETYLELVQPYWCFPTRRQEERTQKIKLQDQHNMLPHQITQDQASFLSKTFLIRYCEEEVEINDIVLFRAEIDVEPDYLATEFLLEVELNFSDLSDLGGPTAWKQNCKFYEKKANFKPVQTQTYAMSRLPTGVCEFVPVNFQGQFFSLLNLQVQSVMLDLRFRQNNSSHVFEKIKTVTDFFFAGVDGVVPTKLDLKETEKMYNEYRRVLQRMYGRIQNQYSFFRQFMLEENLKALQLDQAGSVGAEDPQLNFSILPMDEPNVVADQLLINLNTMASHTVILQHQMTEIFKHESSKISKHLQLEYQRLMHSKVEESIIRQVIPTNNFALMSYDDGKISEEDIQEQHRKCARAIRLAKEQAEELAFGGNVDQLNIGCVDAGQKLQVQPILFEECFVMANSFEFIQMVKSSTKVTTPVVMHNEDTIVQKPTGKPVGVHLFVMVHGFQGNHNDLRGLKNRIALRHPGAMFLLSTSNEDRTEEDVMEAGERLAKEVKQFIIESCPGNSMRRLSFVGFSMGGLICRAAFPLLESYQNKFFTFISLSSPHLGYMYNSNKLFETGMWFLKKWKKSKSLAQLSMTDTASVEQSCLYKLSSMPGLDWFENILLVCSNQDQYVPFDSARIQICKEALTEINGEERIKGNYYIQMTWNLLQKLKTKLLYRIDVDFQIPNKNMDSWIGRTAHIKLLESVPFLEMLVYRYNDFLS